MGRLTSNMGRLIWAALFTLVATPALADPTGGLLTALVTNLVLSSIPVGTAVSLVSLNAAIGGITALVSAGLYVGAAAVPALIAANRKTDVRNPERAQDTINLTDAPMLVVLGRARLAGNLLYGNASTATGPNLLYRHRGVCAGPISGFEEFYLNRREVFREESTGEVTSPPYGPGGYAYIKVRIGEAIETAFVELPTAFPGIIGDDHRGDHLAQTLSIFAAPDSENYLKVFPNGKPETEVVLRGELPYDPRIGTTAWTDNGPLCVLHFLTMPSYLGWGLPREIFDMDDIAITADAADAPISLAEGGTEPRSRCSGVYSTDRPRGEVLADLLLSTGVQFVRLVNGKYSLRLIEDNPVSELTIPLKAVKEFEWASGPESVERPNRLAVKYYDPSREYKSTPLDLRGLRWGEDLDEIELVGERLEEITLNFCQWHGQASRIGRRMWFARRANRGSVVTNLAGLGVLGKNTITLPFVGIGANVRVTPVQPRLEADGITVSIPFVESPTIPAYDPALDQSPPPASFTQANGSIPEPDFGGVYAQVYYPDGQGELRFQVAAETPYGIEAAARFYSGSIPGGWVPANFEGADCAFFYPADAEGTRVDFKARHFDSATFEISGFAETTIDTVYVDNTTPEEPHVGLSGGTVIGHEFQVAYFTADIRFKRGTDPYGDWQLAQTSTLRPNQVVAVTYPSASPPLAPGDRFERRVTSYTTNDTAGPSWTEETIV